MGLPHREPVRRQRSVKAAPDGRGGLGTDVGQRMPEHQQAEARQRDECVAEHGKPRRRHMHEHDFGRMPLLVVERRGERHIEAYN